MPHRAELESTACGLGLGDLHCGHHGYGGHQALLIDLIIPIQAPPLFDGKDAHGPFGLHVLAHRFRELQETAGLVEVGINGGGSVLPAIHDQNRDLQAAQHEPNR